MSDQMLRIEITLRRDGSIDVNYVGHSSIAPNVIPTLVHGVLSQVQMQAGDAFGTRKVKP